MKRYLVIEYDTADVMTDAGFTDYRDTDPVLLDYLSNEFDNAGIKAALFDFARPGSASVFLRTRQVRADRED